MSNGHGKLHGLGDIGDHSPSTLEELNNLISGDSLAASSDISTLSGDVAQNTSDISNISGDVISNTSDIIDLSGDWSYADTAELIYSPAASGYTENDTALSGHLNGLYTQTKNQYHVVYVATNGNDTTGNGSMGNPYLTIKAANTSITDSSATNRYVIKVAPGLYEEDNPLVLKSYVNIWGEGGLGSTRIIAINNSSDLIQIPAGLISIHNTGLEGPTTAGYAINVTNISKLLIRDIALNDCVNGIHINNSSCGVDIESITVQNTTVTTSKIIYMEAGVLNCNDVLVSAQRNITTGININGTNSF